MLVVVHALVLGHRQILFATDAAPHAFYALSLHDALPISVQSTVYVPTASVESLGGLNDTLTGWQAPVIVGSDRKSTRLNSSHQIISYAVFCLKINNGQAHERRRAARQVVDAFLRAGAVSP